MQSEPVSPPPMTTTCLPLARDRAVGRGDGFGVAGAALVLLGEEVHGEMDAGELAAGQPAGRAAAPRRRTAPPRRSSPSSSSTATSSPTSTPVRKVDALGLHLRHAAVDQVLLHLEVGDAVAQQAADAVALLEQRHRRGRRGPAAGAQARPAGPEPTTATRRPVASGPDLRLDPALAPSRGRRSGTRWF